MFQGPVKRNEMRHTHRHTHTQRHLTAADAKEQAKKAALMARPMRAAQDIQVCKKKNQREYL